VIILKSYNDLDNPVFLKDVDETSEVRNFHFFARAVNPACSCRTGEDGKGAGCQKSVRLFCVQASVMPKL
jgi:hypothetical protein